MSASSTSARGVDSEGNLLVTGDRVEAKYKGKGTKFYPGKVTNVTPGIGGAASTFSLLYDDGDTEEGGKSENIRRIGPSKGSSITVEAATLPTAVVDTTTTTSVPTAEISTQPLVTASATSLPPSSSATLAAAAAVVVPPVIALEVPSSAPLITSRPGSAIGGTSSSSAGAVTTTAAAAAVEVATSHLDSTNALNGGIDIDGKILVTGDRVEAKYKGKGTKFYPGCVAGVTLGIGGAAATFSLLYDDGDKEEGAKSENIRRIGPSKAPEPVTAASTALPALPLAALPLAALPEPVIALSSTPALSTSSITTVVAAAAAAAIVANLSNPSSPADETTSSSPPPPAPAAAQTDKFGARGVDAAGKTLVIGDRVEAKFKGKGTKFYPGAVTSVTPGIGGAAATFSLLYDDGDKEEGAKSENIQRIGPSKCEDTTAIAVPIVLASTVVVDSTAAAITSASNEPAVLSVSSASAASTSSTTDLLLPAVVTAVVVPVPVTSSSSRPGSAINVAPTSSVPTTTAAVVATVAPDTFGPRGVDIEGKILVTGDRVEAKYKGKGTKFYPGAVTSVTPGVGGAVATFSLLYDDGDKEEGAKSENIQRIGPSKCDAAVVVTSIGSVTESVPLVAATITTTTATPATVSAAVSAVVVAPVLPSVQAPTSTSRPGSAVTAPTIAITTATVVVDPTAVTSPRGVDCDGKTLVVNDKVEAKFKGKGTKFYPGTVTCVTPGGSSSSTSFTILYDDGDREEGALPANVRRVGESKGDVAVTVAEPVLIITAASAAATVTPVASIVAAAAAVGVISTPSTSRPGSSLGSLPGTAPVTTTAPTITATALIPTPSSATITAPSLTPSPPAAVAIDERFGVRGKDLDGKVLVTGDRVEAKFKGKGTKFYSGVIASVSAGIPIGSEPTFAILYDDGDKEEGAKCENVRRVGESKYESTPAVAVAVVPLVPLVPAVGVTSTTSAVLVTPPIPTPTPTPTPVPIVPVPMPLAPTVVATEILPPRSAAPTPSSSSSSMTSTSRVPSAPLPMPIPTSAPATPAPFSGRLNDSSLYTGGATPSAPAFNNGTTTAAVASANYATVTALASLGRLARELAALRVRVRPALFDAHAAQMRARAQAVAPIGSPAGVEAVFGWLLQSLAGAQTRYDAENAASGAGGGTLASVWQGASIGDVVSTLALRDALRQCGYAAGKDALAVLRSAFRTRPGMGTKFPFTTAAGRVPSPTPGSAAASGDEHAAILTDPLASFLVAPDDLAMALLAQVDEMSHSRSGRMRPPTHTAGSSSTTFMGGTSTTTINGGGGGGGAWGTGSLAASVVMGGGGSSMSASSTAAAAAAAARGLVTPQRTSSLMTGGGNSSSNRFGAGASASLPASLGDWMRRHATDGERNNLVALMGLLADFQARNGLPSLPLSAGGSEGADTVVVPLGPSLKVGLRVYV